MTNITSTRAQDATDPGKIILSQKLLAQTIYFPFILQDKQASRIAQAYVDHVWRRLGTTDGASMASQSGSDCISVLRSSYVFEVVQMAELLSTAASTAT